MSDLVVRNASEICLPEDHGTGVERLARHALRIRDGRVVWLGPEADLVADDSIVYDAAGGAVLPALVDCHTHLVHAGNRIDDFERRSRGMSYAEIAAEGGGIHTTVNATRAASREDLVTRLRTRLEHRRRYGIGTTEVKSGYGLSAAHEIRMLEVADAVRQEGWDLELTLLAAHTIPKDQPREDYLRQIAEEIIPEVASRGLARFVDVFVERGAYSVEEARFVFAAAARNGLIPRVHADQLTAGGGAELAAEVGAASADHLERVTVEGIRALATNRVVATLLPGAAVFLGDECRGLGRKLVDGGVEVAVATDSNPGSSPLMNLPLAATFATTLMGLTAGEALRAVTLGGAHALRRDDIGTLRPGARARFIVLHERDSRALAYSFGEPIVRDIVLSG